MVRSAFDVEDPPASGGRFDRVSTFAITPGCVVIDDDVRRRVDSFPFGKLSKSLSIHEAILGYRLDNAGLYQLLDSPQENNRSLAKSLLSDSAEWEVFGRATVATYLDVGMYAR
jgi:hypothetical protein